jgi:type II secretory pathway component GspD/PulD (secretin)
MTSSSRVHIGTRWAAALSLLLVLALGPAPVLGAPRVPFTFEHADIAAVIAEVARLTGTTFLFDPARVSGAITVLAPREVTPAEARELLRSALALHGYAMLARPEGVWIVPADDAARADFVVRVVPLTYADAGEVAATLAWIAPPGLRVAPYLPANSVVIAGHAAGVDAMMNAIHRR